MIKSQEISTPNSCLNRARPDEYLFVLLGRDAAAPVAVRAWAEERLRLGLNKPDDPQIVEARDAIGKMEAYRLVHLRMKAEVNSRIQDLFKPRPDHEEVFDASRSPTATRAALAS